MLVMLSACGGESDRQLSVVVRTTPAAWYFEGNQAKGIDHDLLTRFAESQGAQLEISHVANTRDALDALCNPRAQMAVGLLTLPPDAQQQFRTGPRYDTMRQQLLHRFDQPSPESTADLVMGDIEVTAEPAHLETLFDIKQYNGDLGNWTLHENLSAHGLLMLVDQGFADYAVADSHAVAMTRRFYPRIKEAFYIGGELPLYWVFGDCADDELVLAVTRFFVEAAADHTLKQILDRYLGHATRLDYPEKIIFIENVDRRLGEYRDLFTETALEVGLDWKLLAALSYQESHWDPQARSPSGVEGLMMLTLETAAQFDVTDRKDPTQSVRAGARFLLELKERLPPELAEPDRTWFALAAYNTGLVRVRSAMEMARARGSDPLLWVNVSDLLRRPRNLDPKRVRRTPHLLNDPYVYVYNVRAYFDLLAWLEGSLRFDVRGETDEEPTGPTPL